MPSTLVSLLCCSMLMLRHGWQWQRHSTPGGCAMLLCRLYIFRLTPLSRLFSRTVFSSSSVLYFKRRGRGGWSGMGEIFGVVVVGCVLLPFAWAAEQHREWVERDESWVGEEMKEEKKVEGGFCEWARECERFFFLGEREKIHLIKLYRARYFFFWANSLHSRYVEKTFFEQTLSEDVKRKGNIIIGGEWWWEARVEFYTNLEFAILLWSSKDSSLLLARPPTIRSGGMMMFVGNSISISFFLRKREKETKKRLPCEWTGVVWGSCKNELKKLDWVLLGASNDESMGMRSRVCIELRAESELTSHRFLARFPTMIKSWRETTPTRTWF